MIVDPITVSPFEGVGVESPLNQHELKSHKKRVKLICYQVKNTYTYFIKDIKII